MISMLDQNTPATPNDDFDDLFEGSTPAPVAGASTINVPTTTADAPFVPVDGPTNLRAVIERSGLSLNGAVQYWMDGVQVSDLNTIIPVGGSVTVVGSVKGG
jgi:hypothetical protein